MVSQSNLLKAAIKATDYLDDCGKAVIDAESNRTMAEAHRQFLVQNLLDAIAHTDATSPIIVCYQGNYYEIYRDANVVPHIRRVNIVNI